MKSNMTRRQANDLIDKWRARSMDKSRTRSEYMNLASARAESFAGVKIDVDDPRRFVEQMRSLSALAKAVSAEVEE